MRSFLSICIKEQLLKKRNLIMLLIIPLLITYICTYFENVSRAPSKVYNIGIIDHDKTELSSSLIMKIKEHNEISLSIEQDLDKSLKKLFRGKYDVVYEIKSGFQKKIQNREFDDILISHKEVNSTTVKWLNDQISLIVVRDWLYVDGLSRIRSLISDYNEEEYRQKFESVLADNKILSLKVHKISSEEVKQEEKESKGSSAFKILWASIILFVLISFGKKVVEDREKGIIVRLALSGISKIKYYITGLIIQVINVIIPFVISYFMMCHFNIKTINGFFITLLLTIGYTISTTIIIIMIGYLFNTKRSYNFASQVFFLISIIFGTGLVSGMFKSIDFISWLLPLKWYI